MVVIWTASWNIVILLCFWMQSLYNRCESVVLKVLTNKCRCKQDAALCNCCNIEYNHCKIFTTVAKPMRIANYNHCNLQFFSCVYLYIYISKFIVELANNLQWFQELRTTTELYRSSMHRQNWSVYHHVLTGLNLQGGASPPNVTASLLNRCRSN